MTTISVLVPTRNRASLLEKAVHSALSQTVPDLEVVIADNASTDETERTARALASSDTRVRYIRRPLDIGLFANWDSLLHEHARGRYAMLLPDDDRIIDTGFLLTATTFMHQHQLVALFAPPCFEDVQGHMNTVDFPVPELPSVSWWQDNLGRRFSGVDLFPSFATVFDVNHARAIQAYRPGVFGLDYEFYLRLIISGPTGYLHGNYFVGLEHPGNDSRRSEMPRIVAGLDIFDRIVKFADAQGLDADKWSATCSRLRAIFVRKLLLPVWISSGARPRLLRLYRLLRSRDASAARHLYQDSTTIAELLLRRTPGLRSRLRRVRRRRRVHAVPPIPSS